VIYTAHFDHVGVNKKGEAFNGADDNASGSMALLEVAQAYMKLKKKPARTILFAWVNGEEKGLLGSESYAMNPVIPLENTLIDINLDMVGRSRTPADSAKFMGFDPDVSPAGEIYMYTDQKGKDILDLISTSAKKTGIVVTNKGTDHPFGSSDHASFRAKGVPSMFFNSGVYSDLHSINDDVEKIDFDKMERVSKMVFLIGYDIANQKKRFVPDTIKTTPREE
jgi:Zn-dependent M28 family amino/carboxypeptidase